MTLPFCFAFCRNFVRNFAELRATQPFFESNLALKAILLWIFFANTRNMAYNEHSRQLVCNHFALLTSSSLAIFLAATPLVHAIMFLRLNWTHEWWRIYVAYFYIPNGAPGTLWVSILSHPLNSLLLIDPLSCWHFPILPKEWCHVRIKPKPFNSI